MLSSIIFRIRSSGELSTTVALSAELGNEFALLLVPLKLSVADLCFISATFCRLTGIAFFN